MTAFKSVLALFLGMICAGAGHSAPAIEEISYKGIKLDVDERTFVEKFVNQGFVCGPATSGVGRTCVSKVATFAGKVSETTAQFVAGKLISILIQPKLSEIELVDLAEIVAIEYELISKYGNPQATKSNILSNRVDRSETKEWTDKAGTLLATVQMSTYRKDQVKIFNWLSISISIKDHDKLFDAERRKALKI